MPPHPKEALRLRLARHRGKPPTAKVRKEVLDALTCGWLDIESIAVKMLGTWAEPTAVAPLLAWFVRWRQNPAVRDVAIEAICACAVRQREIETVWNVACERIAAADQGPMPHGFKTLVHRVLLAHPTSARSIVGRATADPRKVIRELAAGIAGDLDRL
jgi:hypothetical protein